MSRNTMLRDFLRSRRAPVIPEEAGLPLGPGARRVPDLRREEVADLAGFEMSQRRSLSSISVGDVIAEQRVEPGRHADLTQK